MQDCWTKAFLSTSYLFTCLGTFYRLYLTGLVFIQLCHHYRKIMSVQWWLPNGCCSSITQLWWIHYLVCVFFFLSVFFLYFLLFIYLSLFICFFFVIFLHNYLFLVKPKGLQLSKLFDVWIAWFHTSGNVGLVLAC